MLNLLDDNFLPVAMRFFFAIQSVVRLSAVLKNTVCFALQRCLDCFASVSLYLYLYVALYLYPFAMAVCECVAVVGWSSPYLEICRPVEMPRLSVVVVVIIAAVCGHNCTCGRAKLAVLVALMTGGLPVGQRTTNTEQQTTNTTNHTHNPRNALKCFSLSLSFYRLA